ncbi:conserved hypothetical protein [Nostocoides japonicum T1-X7]|uniref:Peptidase n=1 Tax=Nostocoides japonicum T1-X7 TaxID=1194083 RepID=A0A077LXF0_9MICO|nr:hypothetical protein [Tetrasphaera japonica]CCH78366.1 conserved hypothetical protein [Tetrasphaera japonica T1-X7]
MDESRGAVEISALQGKSGLAGFLVAQRWPDNVHEWGEFLLMAVKIAAVPGLLGCSTVFRVKEEVPDADVPGVVGMVIAEGPVVGPRHAPPHPDGTTPPGLVVLHPPGTVSVREIPDDVASGCVLLPGIPYLGLDHQAAWARSDRLGALSEMHTNGHVDPEGDVDTAVLAMFLAA